VVCGENWCEANECPVTVTTRSANGPSRPTEIYRSTARELKW